MNINYIILAHRNAEQLKRLIETLDSNDCFFYIHIDKNVDIEPFYKEIKAARNIHFVDNTKRQSSSWGDIGVVVAMLHMLELIISGKRKGYCVLLSGQDYPLKNNSYINTFFRIHYGKEFLNRFSLPSYRWPDGGMKRITDYRINFSSRRGDFAMYPSVFKRRFYTKNNIGNIVKLVRGKRFYSLLRLFRPRKFPRYLKPYGGSSWWAITIETASKIIQYINDHPDYLAYHQHTLSSDEIFFHSVIMDIHKESPDQVVETITYANWEHHKVSLPVTFTIEDFQELRQLPDSVLFARKFDQEIDSAILDAIDRYLITDHYIPLAV